MPRKLPREQLRNTILTRRDVLRVQRSVHDIAGNVVMLTSRCANLAAPLSIAKSQNRLKRACI